MGPDGGSRIDLVAHAVIFGLLTAVALWCFGRRGWVLVGLLCYAVLTEIVQWLFVPGRSGSALDVVADAVGISLVLIRQDFEGCRSCFHSLGQ